MEITVQVLNPLALAVTNGTVRGWYSIVKIRSVTLLIKK
jgi:hypothetical protein